MNKTLSVIIPTYNRAGYIVEAIESVLAQKVADFTLEIIVVDDGSKDNTDAVLEPYIRSNKILYFKLPHSGKPAVPRNYGIKKASGELIAFQDSDDLWASNKLHKQLHVFDDQLIVLSYGNAETIDKNSKQTGKQIIADSKLRRGEKFASLLRENVISTLTVVVRKSIVVDAGGFNEDDELRAVEDYDLWLRIAARHPGKVKAVPDTLAYYRVHGQNISKADGYLSTRRLLAIFNRHWFFDLVSADRAALEARIGGAWESLSFFQKEAGKAPEVSVVLSIYQAEDHLRPAIESILKQTSQDFEFLIIDDGCTDKSVEIVKSYTDERIKLIHQTNHGLVYSLNKGVRLACAELIARQDADDISAPNRLEKELAWMKESPKRALVGGFFTYIDEKSSRPSTTITSPTFHEDLRRMLRIVNPFAHGSVLVRREAILAAGGYRDTYGPTEDYDLWRRIAPHWEIGQIPEVLYLYRINPKSISHTKQKIQHKFAKKISDELWRIPLPRLSFLNIIQNTRYYKSLPKYGHDVRNQYIHQQVLFSFESLIRGRFLEGYESALAAFLLKPIAAIRLWKIIIWAPIKLALGRRVK